MISYPEGYDYSTFRGSQPRKEGFRIDDEGKKKNVELEGEIKRGKRVLDASSDTAKNPSNSFYSCKNSNENESTNIFINSPPKGLEREYEQLFTNGALEFMIDLVLHFERDIEELYERRLRRRGELWSEISGIPKLSKAPDAESRPRDWKISPVGEHLENRHLDLGDVSPSNVAHLCAALKSPVQGIQVDFDDGHCPTWRNQISGLHNIFLAVRNRLPDAPKIQEAPILMLRPRAWNMIEKNASINGRRIVGPIFDFCILVYHNARKIIEKTGRTVSFYLSKLETAKEAKLWNEIFAWSETRLELSRASFRACVLVENILAAFEIDDILWELRERSLGLNCGIWDYAASIISKFGGKNGKFLLPDRHKYVNADQKFLRSYMRLVVKICHKRGAHATGGMAANLLPKGDTNSPKYREILRQVVGSKSDEIEMGFDGFLVYDLGLVEAINELWRQKGGFSKNQINSKALGNDSMRESILAKDLLSLPNGGVTLAGLEHNIRVGILFIYQWLNGNGHFRLDDRIEDSATAEISRSQIWQWIRFRAQLEDGQDHERVTRYLVTVRALKIMMELQREFGSTVDSKEKVLAAYDLFLELVNRREFPEFITSYLNDEALFRKFRSNL